jgi:hypothetical protein
MDVRARFDIDPIVDLGRGRKAPSLLRLPQGAARGGASWPRWWASGPRVCPKRAPPREAEPDALPPATRSKATCPRLPTSARGAFTDRWAYEAQREGDRTTLRVTREYIANCVTRMLSRGNWKDLEALERGGGRGDLRAQVGWGEESCG